MEPRECGVCGGEALPLGRLGMLAWYRCRQCGAEAFEHCDDEPEEERSTLREVK